MGGEFRNSGPHSQCSTKGFVFRFEPLDARHNISSQVNNSYCYLECHSVSANPMYFGMPAARKQNLVVRVCQARRTARKQLMSFVFRAWYVETYFGYEVGVFTIQVPRAIPPPTADPEASATGRLPVTPERMWPDTDDEFY